MRTSMMWLLCLLGVVAVGQAQSASKPDAKKAGADVLVFANGDQLTGKLQSVTAGNVVFASDMAGTLTISVDKVKELRSGAQFALLRKGERIGKKHVPIGTVDVAAGNLTVTPEAGGAAETVPAADVNYLVAAAEFEKQISQKAGFLNGWGGTLTGGANIARSTTTATTLNAGIALMREIPTVPWMPARNRTTFNLTESYGRLSTPAIPPTIPATPPSVVLNSIFHADAERDEYFTQTVYALAQTSFDHNYAQGLQLQQVYGGGIGWTAIKTATQELNFKADAQYEKQKYITTPVNGATVAYTTPTVNLIGSTFFEGYHRTLPRKMIFDESLNLLPAWNVLADYSANATATLTMPVFKRLSANVTVTDSYLGDPARYFQKNSFQFITGVTYTLP
ncbi:MAG: DUF481 domain-containing protein [Acidobacteria bacterium]|nr:DUF481 domain-containing protein [Acidobacteriota bacterium]